MRKSDGQRGATICAKNIFAFSYCWLAFHHVFFFFTKTPSPSPFFVSQPLYKSQFQHVDAYDNARGFRKKGLKGPKGATVNGREFVGLQRQDVTCPGRLLLSTHARIYTYAYICNPNALQFKHNGINYFASECVYACVGRQVCSRKSFCAISKMPKTVKGPLLSGQSNVVLKVSVVLPFRQLRHRSHGATVNLFVSRDCRQFNVVLKHS